MANNAIATKATNESNVVNNPENNALAVIPDFSKMSAKEIETWLKAANEQKAAIKEAEKKQREAEKQAKKLVEEQKKAEEAKFFTHAKTKLIVNIRARNEELLPEGSKWLQLDEKDVPEIYKLVNEYFANKASKAS